MAELDQELQDLATRIDWPDGHIASHVGQRLRTGETSPVTPMRRQRGARGWRVAAAVAAAAAAVTLAVPSSRAAIGGWFGVRSDRIQVSPTTRPTTITTPSQSSTTPNLDLGPEVALGDVHTQLGFTMPVPRVPDFEHPDEVHVGRPPASGEATLVYRARPDLPQAGTTGVGMLITAFRGDLDPGFFGKTIGPDTRLEFVKVQGGAGYWLEGAPHEFLYRDTSGLIVPETVRLAANVLLWEVNGITVRIESVLPRDDVIRIADAMR
jgi:hypothetical protein